MYNPNQDVQGFEERKQQEDYEGNRIEKFA
jgi:hypothetical protein